MADWSQPTPFHLEALHEALLFAFPSHLDFGNFLLLKLGQSYEQSAPVNANYRTGLTTVLVEARAGGWLADLVRKAIATKPNSPLLRVLDRSFHLVDADLPPAADVALEDIVRQATGMQELMPWLAALEAVGQCTCRIEYPVNTPRGTGWLVGRDTVLTNWHVIRSALPGGPWDPAEFVCRFDYAVDGNGTRGGSEVRLAADWCIDSSPPSPFELGTGDAPPDPSTLDFALLRLARAASDDAMSGGRKRGKVVIAADQPLPKIEDVLLVVQHPDGLPIKLAVGDVKGFADDTLRMYHSANTRGGSSGSVVLDVNLNAVGLHHAGDLLYNDGNIGKPVKNQAIPIGLIARRLAANGHLA